MKQRTSLLAILLLLLTAFISLHAQSPQYENQPIEKLEIMLESQPDCTEKEINSIRSRMRTRQGDFFSQIEFDNDLKALAKDFDRVEPTLQSIGGKMHITLRVWPKPVIRSVIWTGNERVETSKLQKELGIKPYSTFDRLAFNKAFHKLKTYYVRKGFFEAELDYKVILDECTNEADINILIKEGRAGHINDIVFQGFTCEEEEELLDEMVTKKYNLLFSWYTNEGTYHEEAVQQDQYVILNYLQNKGYADAKVEIIVQESTHHWLTKENRIDIHINATKGEIYRFCDISFEGNTIFSNEEIRKQFVFREGSPYSPEKIRETVANIMDLYGRRGYIDANVDYEPSLNCENRTYSLELTIEEGSQYRVGMIKVLGNCATQTNVILHESLLIPGAIFNIEKLKKTEQRLRNIGYFKTVNVFAVKSEGPMGLGECYRDVHIEVEETTTGHFGAFLGYSTAESAFCGINITERNFNYMGLGSVWSEGYRALRGGGEYAHFTAQVGLKSRKYILSWTKPWFMDTPWSVGIDIERSTNRYISDDYEITSGAVIVHANYNINPFLRFGWHWRIKNSDVDIEENHPSRQLVHDSRIPGLISGTGISLTYNSTDHPVTPRSGFRSKAELEYIGLGGDHTYFCLGYLNSYFVPWGDKTVIKYRADFRFILPFGNTVPGTVPLDERFFLGGDTNVRGYRSYRLGPLYPHSDDPRGGISQQYYSIEFARRFHEKIEGFTFFDAGFLSLHRMRISEPYMSVGFGSRLKIMESIPALTVGVGFPLNEKRSSQVKQFFISVGGKF